MRYARRNKMEKLTSPTADDTPPGSIAVPHECQGVLRRVPAGQAPQSNPPRPFYRTHDRYVGRGRCLLCPLNIYGVVPP